MPHVCQRGLEAHPRAVPFLCLISLLATRRRRLPRPCRLSSVLDCERGTASPCRLLLLRHHRRLGSDLTVARDPSCGLPQLRTTAPSPQVRDPPATAPARRRRRSSPRSPVVRRGGVAATTRHQCYMPLAALLPWLTVVATSPEWRSCNLGPRVRHAFAGAAARSNRRCYNGSVALLQRPATGATCRRRRCCKG